jgi:hypothetical protein
LVYHPESSPKCNEPLEKYPVFVCFERKGAEKKDFREIHEAGRNDFSIVTGAEKRNSMSETTLLFKFPVFSSFESDLQFSL